MSEWEFVRSWREHEREMQAERREWRAFRNGCVVTALTMTVLFVVALW